MSDRVTEIIPFEDLSTSPLSDFSFPIFPPGTQDFYILNDQIVGDDGDDLLFLRRGETQILAEGGNDILRGNAKNNLLDGGSGIDTVVYQRDPGGVEVDLATELGQDGYGCSDRLVSIENAIGSEFDDLLVGNEATNSLTGRKGNDRINGRGGDDYLVGSAGSDTLTGGSGSDRFVYLSPNEGGDTIADFEVGIDKITIVSDGFKRELKAGALPASRFGLGSSATTKSQRFIFDDATGDLFFDRNGNRAGGQDLIANLGAGSGFGAGDIELF